MRPSPAHARRRSLPGLLLTLALTLVTAPPAHAQTQTGRITGIVTDSSRLPVPGAQVRVVGTTAAATSDEDGRFTIPNIAPGTYTVRVQRVGQQPQTVPNVTVRAGADTRVDVVMSHAVVSLAGVVVSASRRTEKITDAPATITRLDAAQIENSVGNSFSGALKEVKGVDFIQVGVTAVAVNARGFNSAFNNRMLMLEDSRIATLTESGLPLGLLSTMPKVDLAGVEVLVGPGSALYGPDASNGVITLQSKDPRQYPGTTLEVTGGNRSFYDIQGRHAGVAGNVGYKVYGEYQSANDFSNRNVYAPITTTPGSQPVPEVGANFDTKVARGGGALVYYFQNAGRLEATGAASRLTGIGLTNVGRNQLDGYHYWDAQIKYTHPNWFAQAYHTLSNGGNTFQLNGFSQNKARFPALSDDSIRTLSAFPGQGQLTAGELQNTFALGALNGTRLTWGAQYRHDDVTSERRWLIDRKTGKDVTIDQKGVYAQIDAPLTSWLRAIVSGRYDKHDFYDAQFSPKAGLLLSPTPDQTLRVTFNRAFKSPTILQTSFFFPDFQPFIGVFGNRNGYLIKNAAGTVVNTIDPIEPETNDTWEVGYKGVLRNRLFVDVTGYYSRFDKFMSPLVIIANFLTPAAQGGPTTAWDAKTGEQLAGSTGGPQIPLVYFNAGRGVIHGTDVGVRWLVTPTLAATGTTSLQKVDHIDRKPTDPLEATAFNAPSVKFTLGMDAARLGIDGLRGGFTLRHVSMYSFTSGVNVGIIPTFTTGDINLGYALPALRSQLNFSLQNLFSCTGGTSTPNVWIAAGRPAIYAPTGECGFGKKHIEMLNAPALGTMAFFGIRWER
jgi:iron complex outermembrane receptor protein